MTTPAAPRTARPADAGVTGLGSGVPRLVIASSVRSPLRSRSALVATVVPIFTAAMRADGIGVAAGTPSSSRMPCTAASL